MIGAKLPAPDTCPLCGAPVRASGALSMDPVRADADQIVVCPSCGPYRLSGAAAAVAGLADPADVARVVARLRETRTQGLRDVGAEEFVAAD